jgi:hypothetical protein
MKMLNLSAALMTAGLLVAAPAFAQQPAPAQKQPTQEGGGPSARLPCGEPYNANSMADPNCKQRTQSEVPSMAPTAAQAGTKSK